MTLNTIPDLFQRFRNKDTGHWTVGGDSSRTLYLDSGDIVFAASNFQTDKLATILVEQGKLTQAQMEHALANMNPSLSAGKNLLEMGFITQKDLLEAARLLVERIVLSALAANETPIFEPKGELDESIVKLPLDTPSMLLKGIIGINDKESILELLGPLNQVVQLQGKRATEMDLPDDLAKAAPLMDGTLTIMELSSEAAAEPQRIGAFSLFLREMGWAKLYELPPLDRQALDKALTVPITDPTQPPETFRTQGNKLFNDIADAQKETIKISPELAEELDGILDGMQEPGTQPQAPIGRVISNPPEPKEESPPEDRPIITITLDGPEDADVPQARPTKKTAPSKKWWRIFVPIAILAVVALAVHSIWKLKTQTSPPPFTIPPDNPLHPQDEPQPQNSVDPEGTEAKTEPSAPPPEPAVLAPAKPAPAQQPPPASAKPVDISTAARFASIADGNTSKAIDQGKAYQDTLSKSTWTIRLVVACDAGTLQNCAREIGTVRPELFLASIRLRDGRACYQLFFGKFSTKAAADAEAKKLPEFFWKNNTPKITQLSDISTTQ